MVYVVFLSCCLAWGKQVIIQVDNQEIPVLTFRGSVEDALNKAKVTLRGADEVCPSPDTIVSNGQRVVVTRIKQLPVENEQLVEFGLEKQLDRKLPPGQQKVLQYGTCGIAKVFFLATYRDEQEIRREKLGVEIIQEPKPMIIAYGPSVNVSRSKTRASESDIASIPEGSRVITAVSTAYTHTGYRTASGVSPYRGVVSVDPSIIPLGTKLYVENYGPAVALDTGGDIKGNRIDVFFETYQECISWGRRTVKVHVLE